MLVKIATSREPRQRLKKLKKYRNKVETILNGLEKILKDFMSFICIEKKKIIVRIIDKPLY